MFYSEFLYLGQASFEPLGLEPVFFGFFFFGVGDGLFVGGLFARHFYVVLEPADREMRPHWPEANADQNYAGDAEPEIDLAARA